MRLFRRRVRANRDGVVVSVRAGDRTRITVEHGGGKARYFVAVAKVKVGQNVGAGAVLGLI